MKKEEFSVILDLKSGARSVYSEIGDDIISVKRDLLKRLNEDKFIDFEGTFISTSAIESVYVEKK
ncbi:hypothetical protein [Bacillus mycoides]|uniref:hypothetical protein n=1 Tax=Bacillus mycoides TaxID=1405 RepID=UPI003D650A2A